MPNWSDIAKAIATGMYGDEVQQYKGRKQQMENESTRIQLAQNADTRAQAGEARAQNEFEFEAGNRDQKLKLLQQSIDRGELSLDEAKNQLAIFDQRGGVAGEATRQNEAVGRQVEAHRQGIKSSQAGIANMAADNSRASAAEGRAKTRDEITNQAAQLHLDIQRATKDAQIKGVQDASAMKDAQEVRALVDFLKIAESDDDVAWATQRIKDLSMRNEVRRSGGAVQPPQPQVAQPQQVPLAQRSTKEVMDQWGYK